MKKKFYLLIAMAVIVAIVIVSCENKETKPAVAGPVSDDSLVKRGGYLVSICGCDDCHTPKKSGPMGPEPDMDKRLSGQRSEVPLPPIDTNVVRKDWILTNGELTGWVGPWGASFAANLTSDETGLGNWSEDQFRKAITEGKWKGMDGSRTLLPPMPWQDFKNLTNEDVKAIYLYLKTVKPVKNIEPPIRTFADLK